MKKIIAFSLLIFLSIFQSCGTTKNMEQFYSRYENSATVIPLPSFALRIAGKAGAPELFSYLKSAKIFIIDNAKTQKQETIMHDLKSSFRGENLESLVNFKGKNNNLNIAVKDNGGRINKMIFGVNGFNKVLVLDSKLDVSRADLENALNQINPEDFMEIIEILK